MIKQHYQNLRVSRETHRRVRALAVAHGLTLGAMAEQVFRLGMVAPDLAEALRHLMRSIDWMHSTDWDKSRVERAALAAYQAALGEKEQP